ncbi:Transposase DDE domain protein [Pirellulimonas nuda]|uniref:Transposase DDE domain protein n=1 Tax=Pirellulimonas nuda TaxID=2528009 RepID=A0A518DBS2_9BACT|nr:IS5 family transposase [Pirellulimonas nuda]QDU88934.1 Transposase DDE domain protein [Pirellulimonas nuda]
MSEKAKRRRWTASEKLRIVAARCQAHGAGGRLPLGVAVSGANTHDIKLLKATLDSVPISRPQPTRHRHQHVCLDKGYDSQDVRRFLKRRNFRPHVKSRGQETSQRKKSKRFKARWWVVERTHSWTNRFRRLLVRWEKKSNNYLAMLQLSFAYSTLGAAGVLGKL